MIQKKTTMMNNEQLQNMRGLMQENWQKSGIPENAGRIGSGAAGGMHDRFANVRQGALRDTFAKFNNFDTNQRQKANAYGVPQVKGAASFSPIPEPKVGKDRRAIDPKNKVELKTFESKGNSELDAIQNLFGGGGRSLDAYGGMPQMQQGYPQMQHTSGDLNIDQIYAQKGGSFDPRQMILNKQRQAPQQQQIAGYDSFQQQQQQITQQQPMGYNPNMPVDMQMMQSQYGEYAPQYQQPESEYMQYSVAANQMSPQEQMAEIARNMTAQMLSEYKKKERENQILTKVKHKSYNNLVKDHNGKFYLMETDDKGFLKLKPVRLKRN